MQMSKLNSSSFHLSYNPALNSRAKALRQQPTADEKKLWDKFLKTFEYRILRQRPIHYFIVDFIAIR